jgi:hypothetical protein
MAALSVPTIINHLSSRLEGAVRELPVPRFDIWRGVGLPLCHILISAIASGKRKRSVSVVTRQVVGCDCCIRKPKSPKELIDNTLELPYHAVYKQHQMLRCISNTTLYLFPTMPYTIISHIKNYIT